MEWAICALLGALVGGVATASVYEDYPIVKRYKYLKEICGEIKAKEVFKEVVAKADEIIADCIKKHNGGGDDKK